MKNIGKSICAAIVALGMGASAASALSLASPAPLSVHNPNVHCDFRSHIQHGSYVVEAYIYAHRTTPVHFELRATGSANGGHTNLKQSGEFQAYGRGETMVGRMTLPVHNGIYHLSMAANSKFGPTQCAASFG